MNQQSKNSYAQIALMTSLVAAVFIFALISLTQPTYGISSNDTSESLCPITNADHKLSPWETIQTLTCTQFSVETRGCDCGYGEVKRTDAPGHNMSEFITTLAPTCEQNGHQTSTCKNCDYAIVETLSLLGHQLSEWYVTQEQSCIDEEIQTRVCERCEYEENIFTPALGHAFGDYKQMRAPTCTKPGTKEKVCERCQYTKTASIDALGHDYSKGFCKRCKAEDPNYYPKVYKDSTVTITIYKIDSYGAGNTTCYIADIQLKDYSRFFTACGKNKYGGQSSTSKAAKLQNAVFAVNGCYSAPYLNYEVVRRGILLNGGDRYCNTPAVYSSMTGLFGSPEMLGVNTMLLEDAVKQKLVTDTFCFGPAGLVDGRYTPIDGGGRAQRTFIGTDGKPGHMIIGVCNGRYSDGKSQGLSYNEINQLLLDYGCTFGIPLDGGGSTTMVFKGQVLNQLAGGKERHWIVDFVCIEY